MVGLNGPTMATMVAAGQPVAAPLARRGLIDTGTDVTCIASTVLQQLGLTKPVMRTTTQTAIGSGRVNLFEVSLGILDLSNQPGPSLVVANVLVMEFPAGIVACDVLIGLDILLTTRLVLDGPAGFFSLDC